MTMRKQFWVISILAVALLFSQGGSFLVALLCPHLQSETRSCGAQLDASAMSHGQAEHAKMEHTKQEPMKHDAVVNQDVNASAFDQPNTKCPHCAVHSGTTPNALSLREGEAARRSADPSVELAFSRIARVTAPPFEAPVSRAHGPPGAHVARHLLINTFRI
jgi:hypothetical protein